MDEEVQLTSEQIISMINKKKKEDQTCAAEPRNAALQEVKLDAIREQKRMVRNNPSFSDYPWEDTSKFKKEWLDFVQKNYDKGKIPPSALKEHKQWVELLPNKEHPEETRYSDRNITDMLLRLHKLRWVSYHHQTLFNNHSMHFQEWKALTDEYLNFEFMRSSEEMQKQFQSINRIRRKKNYNLRPFNIVFFFSLLKNFVVDILNVIKKNVIIVLFKMLF